MSRRHTTIVPARDHDKALRALQGFDVEIEAMSLRDPASIDAFAGRFLASVQPLHILVNNAGIMAYLLTRDTRGYEAQFSTNHLGALPDRGAALTCPAPGKRRSGGFGFVPGSPLFAGGV
jgi:NAD(P)-dependent dehydrogenase (short-subunit alcohol dehydrogenase family)